MEASRMITDQRFLKRKSKNSCEVIEQMYLEEQRGGQSGMSEFVVSEVRDFRIMTRPWQDYTIVCDILFQSTEKISYCFGT